MGQLWGTGCGRWGIMQWAWFPSITGHCFWGSHCMSLYQHKCMQQYSTNALQPLGTLSQPVRHAHHSLLRSAQSALPHCSATLPGHVPVGQPSCLQHGTATYAMPSDKWIRQWTDTKTAHMRLRLQFAKFHTVQSRHYDAVFPSPTMQPATRQSAWSRHRNGELRLQAFLHCIRVASLPPLHDFRHRDYHRRSRYFQAASARILSAFSPVIYATPRHCINIGERHHTSRCIPIPANIRTTESRQHTKVIIRTYFIISKFNANFQQYSTTYRTHFTSQRRFTITACHHTADEYQ